MRQITTRKRINYVLNSTSCSWDPAQSWQCHTNPQNARTCLVTEKEILMERGGITVVRSIVHDTINTERLLSECFSQDPPHNRTSSAQGHHLMKRVSGDLAWQFSKHRLDKSKTLGCVPFSLPAPSIIGFWGSHATVSLGMGLFDAKTSTQMMRKELIERKLQLWYSTWTFSLLQILLLVSFNLYIHSLSRRWRASCMRAHHILAWSMHCVAQELCEMGSQQGDGSIRCCRLLSLSVFSHFLTCWEQQLTVVTLYEQISQVWHEGSRKTVSTSWCFLYPAQIGWSDPLYQFTSVWGDLWRRRTLSLCIR